MCIVHGSGCIKDILILNLSIDMKNGEYISIKVATGFLDIVIKLGWWIIGAADAYDGQGGRTLI